MSAPFPSEAEVHLHTTMSRGPAYARRTLPSPEIVSVALTPAPRPGHAQLQVPSGPFLHQVTGTYDEVAGVVRDLGPLLWTVATQQEARYDLRGERAFPPASALDTATERALYLWAGGRPWAQHFEALPAPVEAHTTPVTHEAPETYDVSLATRFGLHHGSVQDAAAFLLDVLDVLRRLWPESPAHP